MRQSRCCLHSVARSLAAVIVAFAAFGSSAGGLREAHAQSSTPQRAPVSGGPLQTASWVFIGIGGAGVAGGIALGVLSVVELRKAREINQASDSGVLSAQQQRAHDAARSARDDFRLGSGIAAGTGLGLFLLGGALLVLDGSSASSSAPGTEDKPSAPDAVKGRERSPPGASVLPLLGPHLAGAMITVRF